MKGPSTGPAMWSTTPPSPARVSSQRAVCSKRVRGQPPTPDTSDTVEITASSELEGYWTVTAEGGVELDLLASAPGRLPTLRRATMPTAPAFWLAGAVYPWAPDTLGPFMDEVATVANTVDSSLLLDGQAAALWLTPSSPDDWAGATINLDVDTTPVEFVALAFDSTTGSWTEAVDGPIDLILAPAVPEGLLTIEVMAQHGAAAEVSWEVAGGVVVDASAFSLPEVN